MTENTPKTPLDLDDRLAALPRDMAPPDKVWQNIESQLAGTDADSSNPSAALYSLAAALFAGVTIAIMLWGSPAMNTPEGFAPVASFELDGMDPAQLMQVRNNLHSSLQLALDELAPQTREVVVMNLARIDAAREEIANALKDDPRNQLLQQMLLSSYTNEITLLNEFTLMAGSAPQRTRL